ncbi:MAG: nuclear transport factor 2 family protein [Polyangiales bacterium]
MFAEGLFRSVFFVDTLAHGPVDEEVPMDSKETQNIQIIKDCYQAFTRGDLPFILERVASTGFERWGVVASGTWRAPWHFEARSRADVAKYFEAVLGALEPLRFEPSLFAAAGEYVYATVHMEYKVRANGKILVMQDIVHKFKMLDGRIVGVRISEDTEHTREVLAG